MMRKEILRTAIGDIQRFVLSGYVEYKRRCHSSDYGISFVNLLFLYLLRMHNTNFALAINRTLLCCQLAPFFCHHFVKPIALQQIAPGHRVAAIGHQFRIVLVG